MGKKEDEEVVETEQVETNEAATDAATTTEGQDEAAGAEESEGEQGSQEAETDEDDAPDPVIPAEVKGALEQEYPALKGEGHGTHNAAKSGLQTDASGSYTPPSQL